MYLNKKEYLSWTTSPCKTWESWIIIRITSSTSSTLQMFLQWLFLSSFRHSEPLNNIPGFGKWAYLKNTPWQLLLMWMTSDLHLVSLHISQLFLQKTGWLRIVPIFPELEFYKFQVVMSAIVKSDSHLPKQIFICFNFLFHLKSSFCS